MMWINRKETECVALDKRQIIDQAMVFYKAICRKAGKLPCGFKASTGWLYNFLKRKEIRNVTLTGEAHSADAVAAKEFPDILKGIIEEGEYHPNAIYNMDEAGLQYKRMSKSTFLAKQVKHARGRKADKSRFTVLFCVNAIGTHKVKPLLAHTAKHPRCYKHLQDMKDAPIYWRASCTSWLTSLLTKDWLLNCFVPEARRKHREDGRPFRFCLLWTTVQHILNGLWTFIPMFRLCFCPQTQHPYSSLLIKRLLRLLRHTITQLFSASFAMPQRVMMNSGRFWRRIQMPMVTMI